MRLAGSPSPYLVALTDREGKRCMKTINLANDGVISKFADRLVSPENRSGYTGRAAFRAAGFEC